MRERFDIVHQAKEQPLAVHFRATAQREAIEPLVVAQIREYGLHRREPSPVLFTPLGREEYGTARSHDLGDDDVPHVATAIANGRVATLLVDADREIPGRFDVSTGKVQYADLSSPHADDLLEDMAESAVKMGSTVVIVPSAQMPSTTGIAAIYRFSLSP